MANTVLITGVTGFLGKVVLAELMRRQEELDVQRCVLLIRGRRRQSARQRFDNAVAPSACFANLPLGWTRLMDVVEGDLSQPGCGLDDLSWRRLRGQVTHVIHCAASVDFDRPVKEACTSNIVSSLNMLQLAQDMPHLRGFVSTSTAYVTPHTSGPIPEQLAPLPRPAEALLADIHGGVDEQALLKETGHANTYTYTKCLAEHLLVQHRGQVPLTIVRPSIISASFRHPEPGWIDSKAAFAGFVVTIGAGLLKVIDADPAVHLDIVPVDHVATVLIDEAMRPRGNRAAAGAPTPIVHAVAGRAHAANIGSTSVAIVRFFRRHRVARRPKLAHLGARSGLFAAREALYHHLPAAVAQAYSRLRQDDKGARKVRRVGQTLATINRVFPYFTHHTFDFVTRRPLPQGFDIRAYVQTVCQGAHTHLMRRDQGQLMVAGKNHRQGLKASAQSLLEPGQSVALRLAARAARGLLDRLFEAVTFDEPAFRRALGAVPPDSQLVLVPTHRSYLDFVLLPYLLATRPDLGVAAPHIAVAEEFVQRPLWGALLAHLGAVPLARPSGAHAATLEAEQLHAMVADGRPLMIFLEGERSRARRLLPLRQDVLEALQATGRTFALVPVGISYERIAEELPFLRELRDAQRRSLNARQLLGWLRRAQRGQVRLGRVHLSADRPVPLLPSASRPEVVAQLQQGLRRATVCTDFHLSAFVRRHPRAGLDVPTLREAILARGGQVLRAGLHDKGSLQLDAALESSTRKHWEDLFAWDLLAHYPHCRAIGAHLKVGHVGPAPKGAAHVPVDEPHLHGLLEALARPISNDYLAVVQALMQRRRPGQDIEVTLAALRAETLMHDATLLPEILAALQAADLVELDGPGDVIRLRAGPHAVWNAFKKSCALSAQAAKGAPAARAKALAGRAL